MTKEFLKEMVDTPSLSGNEFELQKKIIKKMRPLVDDIITDHVGNVISVINPNSKVKVLLDAHIDEIGLTIASIKEDGKCLLQSVGSIRPSLYLGSQVQVITKHGILDGVISHYRLLQSDKVDVSELELDLGTFTKNETSKLIEIGDYVIKKDSLIELQNNNIAGRALDDKIGIYAILNALLMCKQNNVQKGVYASSTVGEETTGNGATFIGRLVNPTCAIIVDVINDTLNYPEKKNRNDISIGKGPVIALGTVMNKTLVDLAKKVAKEYNIPIQYDTTGDRTWTNTDMIHFAKKGIPSLLISIPQRYMHSSAEVCNMNDVDNVSKLIYLIIKELNETTSFNPLD